MIGAAALVALIFIGFIGVRQMTAPTVNERVYLSPWEDGAERPQKNSEDLALQTDSAQGTVNGDSQAEITTEGLELADDSSGQSEDTDTGQFATEVEFELDADQSFFADISALLDDEGRSAEEVMNAYVEALQNLDAEGIGSLVTGTAKEEFEKGMLPILNGEMPKNMVDMYYSTVHDMLPPEMADEVVANMLQRAEKLMRPALKQMYGQAEVVSSEHVGDEFHFRLRVPVPEMSEMPEMPDSVTRLRKIRKENGVWRIYDAQQ